MIFETWALALMVGFIIGSLLDGIFLYRGERHTALTFIGYFFFIIAFFILNLFFNVIPNTLRAFNKKELKWKNYLSVQKKGSTLEVGEAVIIYLVEIVVSFVLSGILTFEKLEGIIGTGDMILGFLIIIGTILSFVSLFLSKLPYPKKLKIPKIILYILISVILLFLIIRYII